MTGVGGFVISTGASREREWADRFAAHIISADQNARADRKERIGKFRQHVASAVEPFFAQASADCAGEALRAVRYAFAQSEWAHLFSGERVAEVHFWLEHFLREAAADGVR